MPLSLDGLPAAGAWQAVAGRSVWWNAAAGDAARAAMTRLPRQMRFTKPPLDVERGLIAAIRACAGIGSILPRGPVGEELPFSPIGVREPVPGETKRRRDRDHGGVAGQRPEDLFLRGPWWTAFWL